MLQARGNSSSLPHSNLTLTCHILFVCQASREATGPGEEIVQLTSHKRQGYSSFFKLVCSQIERMKH